MSFTIIDCLTILFSICTFIADFITDLIVVIVHYYNRDYWYFGLTISFVVIPTLVMTIMSLRWYILDSKDPNSLEVSNIQWIFRVILLTFQLGPVMRYIDAILYGVQFRKMSGVENRKKARRYYQYMIYEDTDATMLRLFECFLEAAPQLVLQVSIMAIKGMEKNRTWTVMIQSISILVSLISLSWSLVTYLRILRMSLPHKHNMNWKSTIAQFSWRFFMIASRVVALALFASEFTYYISIVCSVHWLIMFLWIVTMKTTFCTNRLEELFYNALLGAIFIFCYFNPVDSPSRRRYLFYYSVMFTENIIILILWYQICDPNKWYRLPAFIFYFLSFSIGIILMIVYYVGFHPTGNIQICRSDNDDDEDPNPMTTENKNSKQSSNNQLPMIVVASGNTENTKIDRNVGEKSNENIRTQNLTETKPTSKTSNTRSRIQNYKRQFSDVWTTKNRLLHPRPAVPSV
ncbi:XK-related protein 6 [Sarcoptes scabiei]|uniref:XK-related protein n=1 Tax=Sarcoptes scabiei TaxID=52283 RepID=A0A834RAX4_SARSC|nr:XK-related protein 6 [Sarcoptes scabiei]